MKKIPDLDTALRQVSELRNLCLSLGDSPLVEKVTGGSADYRRGNDRGDPRAPAQRSSPVPLPQRRGEEDKDGEKFQAAEGHEEGQHDEAWLVLRGEVGDGADSA